ncbi:unnamed protein product [Enterobius vermicularis]|uniref:RWD domain-containing protein n=1 Tax=Enterobius vermicularis TaxID=51028 RepID=A0A0N4VK07_ENTVE|nr:unnamed protein product [Enterobius vermicularis]
MSQQEIQLQELEALEAIFPGELEIIDRDYPNIEIVINLAPHSDESAVEDSSDIFKLRLSIRLPPDYPDQVPVLSLSGLEPLFSEGRIKMISDDLYKVAEENLGMPMVFTIISLLQDNIGVLVEDLNKEKEQLNQQKIAEEEALNRKKFEGIRVTPESFREWKLNFDIEVEAAREKEKKIREAALCGKLTGRQLFLRDASLNLSDFAVMQAAGNVEIDESLFDEVSLFY